MYWENPFELPPTSASSTSADPTPADVDERATAPELRPGQLVGYTYFDHYTGSGGQDVTRYGHVLEVTDEGVTVGWTAEHSDPLPAELLTIVDE